MKLVRDRIPELAAGAGQPDAYSQATEAEYGRLLRAKLLEEAAEAARAPGPAELLEELGDVLQASTPSPARPAWSRPPSTAPRPQGPHPRRLHPPPHLAAHPRAGCPTHPPRRFLCVSTPPAFT